MRKIKTGSDGFLKHKLNKIKLIKKLMMQLLKEMRLRNNCNKWILKLNN